MSFSIKLTEQDIRTIDISNMAGHISAMGDHVREAAQFASATLDTLKPEFFAGIDSIVIAGIGGSAIGGDMLKSYAHGTSRIPITVSRGYDLPSYVTDRTLIVVSSYSGNTEETLSAFEQAANKKCHIICLTTGGKLSEQAKALGLPIISQRAGMQPRAAMAYSFIPLILLLDKITSTDERVVSSITNAAALLDELSVRYGASNMNAENPAFDLASHLMHRIPVIYSPAAIYEAVNLRWRGQLQENAKHLAFGNVIPEMNHNEISGWTHPIDVLQHLAVVMLRGNQQDEHERIAKRCEIVQKMLEAKGTSVTVLRAEGETRLERMFSLISFADWTSYYLALLTGSDPTSIPAIDMLKVKLAG